jgi:hypothetical protein
MKAYKRVGRVRDAKGQEFAVRLSTARGFSLEVTPAVPKEELKGVSISCGEMEAVLHPTVGAGWRSTMVHFVDCSTMEQTWLRAFALFGTNLPEAMDAYLPANWGYP